MAMPTLGLSPFAATIDFVPWVRNRISGERAGASATAVELRHSREKRTVNRMGKVRIMNVSDRVF